MPAYGVFVAGTLVVVVLVVLLARITNRQIEPDPAGGARIGDQHITVHGLYTNVVVSQALVVGVLGVLAWVASVPIVVFGVGGHEFSIPLQIGLGLGLGVGLYLANSASVSLLSRLGIDYSEDLRQALTPSGIGGWAVLLVIVLPIIATAEELVFRAAMIGGIAAGVDISPFVLILLSSLAFGAGHGMQGTGGILVTGVLGIVLGTAFVVSGSLLLVVAAHYVINALEFIVHEGIANHRTTIGLPAREEHP